MHRGKEEIRVLYRLSANDFRNLCVISAFGLCLILYACSDMADMDSAVEDVEIDGFTRTTDGFGRVPY